MIIENKSGFDSQSIFQIARRENNSKRSFLLVNPSQGKHIPCDPQTSLSLFKKLGQELGAKTSESETLVIGFAETATAIGTVAAQTIGDPFYIQTTREEIPREMKIIDFSEEHSHAVGQMLYAGKELDLSRIKHIIFAEDEISTGQTIINLANSIKRSEKLPSELTFTAVSIINCMNELNIESFKEQGIAKAHLVRASREKIEKYSSELQISHTSAIDIKSSNEADCIAVPGFINPRLGIRLKKYLNACKALAGFIAQDLKKNIAKGSRTLVLGTEEFMYPAMLTALEISKISECTVKFHATTRSPISISSQKGYPLTSGFRLRSTYEPERTTYIYNLVKYDNAVIVTDSQNDFQPGLSDLKKALQSAGTENIYFYRWTI